MMSPLPPSFPGVQDFFTLLPRPYLPQAPNCRAFLLSSLPPSLCPPRLPATFPLTPSRFPIHNPLAARFGRRTFKRCPELSKLSQTSALQAHSESAKRFPCYSMQKTIVGNCHNCLTILVFLFICFPFCPFCFPETSRKLFPIIGKVGQNFPTIGNFFPIIGKSAFSPRASRLATTRPLPAGWGRGASPGESTYSKSA